MAYCTQVVDYEWDEKRARQERLSPTVKCRTGNACAGKPLQTSLGDVVATQWGRRWPAYRRPGISPLLIPAWM